MMQFEYFKGAKMVCPLRIEFPEAFHHVTSSDNEGKAVAPPLNSIR